MFPTGSGVLESGSSPLMHHPTEQPAWSREKRAGQCLLVGDNRAQSRLWKAPSPALGQGGEDWCLWLVCFQVGPQQRAHCPHQTWGLQGRGAPGPGGEGTGLAGSPPTRHLRLGAHAKMKHHGGRPCGWVSSGVGRGPGTQTQLWPSGMTSGDRAQACISSGQ